jgi:hypothetical protein
MNSQDFFQIEFKSMILFIELLSNYFLHSIIKARVLQSHAD